MLTYPKLTGNSILIKKKHHLLTGFEDGLLDFYVTHPKGFQQ